MQDVMLQTAGAVDVPECLAHEVFYLMPLFRAFGPYSAGIFIHCYSSLLYNFGKRPFTKIITSAVLLVKRFVYNCYWRGGSMLWYHMGAQYDPWRICKMRFERITDTQHEMYKRAMVLYADSFPLHEQREAKSQASILGDSEYHLHWPMTARPSWVRCCTGNGTATFTSSTSASCRRCGIKHTAAKFLSYLQRRTKGDPRDRSAGRRYIHPPPRLFMNAAASLKTPLCACTPAVSPGNKGHELVVMSRPGKLSAAEYNCFRDYLNGHVMKNVF